MNTSNIPRVSRTSSQIESIGYDGATQTLAVEFKPKKGQKTGGVYHYTGFSQEDWEKFRSASSTGSYFYANIKGNFPYTKVEAAN